MKLIISLVIALIVIVAAAWWWQSNTRSSATAVGITNSVHMTNGDTLQGQWQIGQIEIETPYAQINVPPDLFLGATNLAGQQNSETLIGKGGDRFSGTLSPTEINLLLPDGNSILLQKDMITHIESSADAAAPSGQNDNPPDAVAMRNGDNFQATIVDDEFIVETMYGVLTLRKPSLELIDFSGGNDELNVKIRLNDRASLVNGVLKKQQIQLRTRAGQELDLKPAQFQRIAFNSNLTEVADDDLRPLNNHLSDISQYSFNAAGFTFRDPLSDQQPGPEMILIPAGTYQMGSPESEEKRDNDENQHAVTIEKPFAVGKYEVTFAEYDIFAEQSGREKPYDHDWGRDNQPVLNVSWQDALAYARWLSEQTGKSYRLLTEAEWEYVARAGTTTTYWWGDTLKNNMAICKDCSSQWQKRQSAPVGLSPANGFGVHDILGNVWEWTCSNYQENYLGTESQCAADNNEELITIRGGAYLNNPAKIRSADRDVFSPLDSNELVGFRLARDL